MHFETTINLGNIISATAFFVTLYTFHRSNIIRMAKFEEEFRNGLKLLEEIKEKAETIPALTSKMDLIWDWFRHRQQ